MHCTFDTPNLPYKITIMIIKAGQKCIVNYSDRMCDSNRPDWQEKTWCTKENRTWKKYDVLKNNFCLYHLVINNASLIAGFNQFTVGLLCPHFSKALILQSGIVVPVFTSNKLPLSDHRLSC